MKSIEKVFVWYRHVLMGTMKTVIALNLLLIPIIFLTLPLREKHALDPTTTAERIENAGYCSETHNITTKDGYGFTIFRIKNSSANSNPRPVVLMMHGLTSSSDMWILPGLANPLALELVDQGYDVWLGNCRGNTYGKRHLNMTSNERKFWHFSFHEIASIDLPHIIDFILEETQQTALHYVGHSQGSTIAFVLLSTQPKYNEKLKTAHMFAPIAYVKNATSRLFRILSFLLGKRQTPLNTLLGDTGLFQQKVVRQLLGFERCRSAEANPEICAYILYRVFGGDSAYLNKTLLPEIFNTHPAAASTHQGIHFMQQHISGHFRRYDYGTEGNLQRYNQYTPPDYNVDNINTRFPLHFYYSDFDEYSSKTDVEMFSQILANRSVNHFIDLKNFAHMDFTWSSIVKEVINEQVLKIMNEAEAVLQQDAEFNLDIEVR